MKGALLTSGIYFCGLMAIDAGVNVKIVLGVTMLAAYFIGDQRL